MINGYFIWDKISPINKNCTAEMAINSDVFFRNTENIVFFTNNDKPVEHADLDRLRFEMQLPKETSLDDVAIAYIEKKRIEEEESKKDQITLEKQANRIVELEQGQANTEYILMEGGLI